MAFRRPQGAKIRPPHDDPNFGQNFDQNFGHHTGAQISRAAAWRGAARCGEKTISQTLINDVSFRIQFAKPFGVTDP